jgi:hemolysin-activating ACP:hemolysin acyltransferase
MSIDLSMMKPKDWLTGTDIYVSAWIAPNGIVAGDV